MGLGNTTKVLLQGTAVLLTIIAMGFTIGAFMTTAWAVYQDPGTGEIHQHGLWLDYLYDVMHVGNKPGSQPEWIPKTKFGDAVRGDEVHRASYIQINTLILLCVTTLLGLVGSICACLAKRYTYAIAGWIFSMFMATLLSTSAVIMFYVHVLNHRFITTDKKLQQEVGYSYWCALAGAALFAIAMFVSIVYGVFAFLANRNGERSEIQTRPRTLTPKLHITSL